MCGTEWTLCFQVQLRTKFPLTTYNFFFEVQARLKHALAEPSTIHAKPDDASWYQRWCKFVQIWTFYAGQMTDAKNMKQFTRQNNQQMEIKHVCTAQSLRYLLENQSLLICSLFMGKCFTLLHKWHYTLHANHTIIAHSLHDAVWEIFSIGFARNVKNVLLLWVFVSTILSSPRLARHMTVNLRALQLPALITSILLVPILVLVSVSLLVAALLQLLKGKWYRADYADMYSTIIFSKYMLTTHRWTWKTPKYLRTNFAVTFAEKFKFERIPQVVLFRQMQVRKITVKRVMETTIFYWFSIYDSSSVQFTDFTYLTAPYFSPPSGGSIQSTAIWAK